MTDLLRGVEADRARLDTDRPGPAIPLLLLAAVVGGGIVFAILDNRSPGDSGTGRMVYWVVASAVAYLVMILVARHQGYQRGIWVDHTPLVAAGMVALIVLIVVSVLPFTHGNLTARGNLPVLALALGVLAWALRERRPSLWIVAATLVPLALLAVLYNVENLLYRLGLPRFVHDDEIANLGVVVLALLIAAGCFAIAGGPNGGRLRWQR